MKYNLPHDIIDIYAFKHDSKNVLQKIKNRRWKEKGIKNIKS